MASGSSSHNGVTSRTAFCLALGGGNGIRGSRGRVLVLAVMIATRKCGGLVGNQGR